MKVKEMFTILIMAEKNVFVEAETRTIIAILHHSMICIRGKQTKNWEEGKD